MIEARIYCTVNGKPRTFVAKGVNSNEADRNARRRLHIYMDTNGDTSSFEDNIAQKAGVDHKVEWDGPGMKVKNMDHLNGMIHVASRKGWTA